MASLRQNLVSTEFNQILDKAHSVNGVNVLAAKLTEANADTLRQMVDRFRQRYPVNGVVVLASVLDDRPTLIAAITDDLVKRGLNASELVKFVAAPLGGGGGGKPSLAQAGGKDASKLPAALDSVIDWVKARL
jgi:alanyl-tRNA synthetase